MKESFQWDWAGAEQAYKRAVSMKAGTPDAFLQYAFFLAAMNRPVEADAMFQNAVELGVPPSLAHAYRLTRTSDQKELTQLVELQQKELEQRPRTAYALWQQAFASTKARNWGAAEKYLLEQIPLMEGDIVDEVALLGHVYGRMGRKADALKRLAQLDELERSNLYVSPVLRAWIHIGLGDNDRAFSYLDAAITQRAYRLGLGVKSFSFIYDPVRDDPRFTALMRKMKLESAGSASKWTDPSPHAHRTVSVNGVRLDVLEWPGGPRTLVMIPGSGDSPHVYDAIAPQLTGHFRVVSYARRGDARSEDKPPYDVATMVEDLRQLLDHLGIARADLAGWSLGGHEITAFAGLYPERVGKLVYLDAGYDWSDPQWLDQAVPRMPVVEWAPPPDALESFELFKTWFSTRGPRAAAGWTPSVEAYARDYVTFAANGSIQYLSFDSTWLKRRIEAVRNHRRDYTAVKAPALSIYVPEWLPRRADSSQQSAYNAWMKEYLLPWQDISRARFLREIRNSRAITLRGGDHMSFLFTEEQEIVRILRDFLSDAQ